MPVTLDWKQIALRLGFTVLAGLVIGFNRGEHGRPAGLRTTLLVCLAASLSMILANVLMLTTGKSSDSFVVLDLMRLPLGILSGMGFIGAGTILRKGSLVVGITTAATLWYVTMMGLCFGAGQIALGLSALAIGWLTLWGLKYVETLMPRDHRGTLTVSLVGALPDDAGLRDRLTRDGAAILSWGSSYVRSPERREISCEIQWRARPGELLPPSFVAALRADPAVAALVWRPQGLPSSAGVVRNGSAEAA